MTLHWIWYVFPQLKGLKRSYDSEFYGVSGLEEAKAYLEHPVLGRRLWEVCDVILGLPTGDARERFGGIDSRKLRSSMTLFDLASPDDVFARVLDKFFDGCRCRTYMTNIIRTRIMRFSQFRSYLPWMNFVQRYVMLNTTW